MRSTLFYIPHVDRFFEIPIFGVGWLLGLLIISSLIVTGLRVRRHGWKSEYLSELPLFLLLAAAIVWGAPLIEERTAEGVAVGVPIRGYGMMVLVGIVLSVSLLVHESRRMGLNPDVIMSLAFWMVITGFIGARVFYILEYWHQFSKPTVRETLISMAMLTDGGLVVYGSFIGASVTVVVFVRRHKLPLLAIADLLGPGLVLGVTFGRLGCFLNGCCFGGYCDENSALGVSFPQGSPPFIAQIEDGSMLDMEIERSADKETHVVKQVQQDGLGAQRGFKSGDTILRFDNPNETALNRMRHGEDVPEAELYVTKGDGNIINLTFGDLPKRTMPIYPSQLLSSINGAILCLFLWAYYPMRRRDGEVAAILVTIYPITRILLEHIRNDEGAFWSPELFGVQFGFTISQTISLSLLACVVALCAYILTRPRGSALPLSNE